MSKKNVSIMDINSSKITVLIGSLGVNNTFIMRGKGEAEYAGYMDGEFLEPDKLEKAMAMAISNAEEQAKIKIELLYTGIPSDFLYVNCFEVEKEFASKKTITKRDLNELNSNLSANNMLQGKTIISCSPIWYMMDDNRRMFTLPYRAKSSILKAKLSLIYAENDFIKIINTILARLDIKSVDYIATPLAESRYLLSKFERDKKAIIIDSDYISTSVIEVWGNGLMALSSFPLGGGFITADLSEKFNINFSDAEKIKNNIILSINSKRTDNYEIFTKDEVVSVPIKVANEIVLSRIKMIANLINRGLKQNEKENGEIASVYLTGSGLSYINGTREYLGKYLGMEVNLLVPPMPSMASPKFSSSLSIMYMALKEKNIKHNWLKRLLKI